MAEKDSEEVEGALVVLAQQRCCRVCWGAGQRPTVAAKGRSFIVGGWRLVESWTAAFRSRVLSEHWDRIEGAVN